MNESHSQLRSEKNIFTFDFYIDMLPSTLIPFFTISASFVHNFQRTINPRNMGSFYIYLQAGTRTKESRGAKRTVARPGPAGEDTKSRIS